jgi:hypothetical protein
VALRGREAIFWLNGGVTIGVAALALRGREASSGYDMGDIKVMACIGVTEGEINGAPVLWRLDIFF